MSGQKIERFKVQIRVYDLIYKQDFKNKTDHKHPKIMCQTRLSSLRLSDLKHAQLPMFLISANIWILVGTGYCSISLTLMKKLCFFSEKKGRLFDKMSTSLTVASLP